MKPPTVFLGEMTDPEVGAFLRDHQTVIVPTGSTEQHGPHGPLLTDVLVPTRGRPPRRAERRRPRRADHQLRAVLPARRASRASCTSGSRRSWRSSRTSAPRSPSIGFRRIVFLNGHYDNTYAIAYACASAADRMPAGVARLPGQLLGRHDRRGGGRVLRPDRTGLHANRGETSAVMAIDPALVDMDARERRDAALPRGHQPGRRSTPRSSSRRRAPSIGRPTRARGATRARRRPSSASATCEVVTECDGPHARRHRAHVRGDAAALTRRRAVRRPRPRTRRRRA